jgi:hypothetical protein
MAMIFSSIGMLAGDAVANAGIGLIGSYLDVTAALI